MADLDPTLTELSASPYQALADLRSVSPVARVDALGGWVVTGYDAAVEVMRDPVTFTVDDPRFTTSRVIGASMLSRDGGEHTRHRAPFVSPYRQLGAERTGGIESRARELVGGFASDGQAELRTQLAGPLAAGSVLASLNLAVESGEALSWYRDIVAAVTDLSGGLTLPPTGTSAFESLVVAVRKSTESPVLAGARATLSEREVAANAAVVLFGGIETTEGAIANLLWHLFSNPAVLSQVASDRSLLAGALEESLRLEPAASRVDRYATRSTSLGGTDINEGDLVIVSLTGANRDPSVFPDPDRLDPSRANVGRHLTFAQGPHRCLGADMARHEARAAANAMLDRLPGARLVQASSEPPTGLVFRKPQAVTVAWS